MLSQSRVDQCSEMRHMGPSVNVSDLQSSGKSHYVLLESQDFDLYIYIYFLTLFTGLADSQGDRNRVSRVPMYQVGQVSWLSCTGKNVNGQNRA